MGDKAVVYAIESNATERLSTLDGVDKGGERAAEEITRIVEEKKKSHDLTHITLIGFSLGGLYARYAAGLMYDPETRTIGGLRPHALITIASPHLGVKLLASAITDFGRGLSSVTNNSASIQQLFLDDCVRDEKMGQADGSTAVQRHSGYFLSALQSFPCIMLYANSTYDNTVPYATGMAIGHDVDSIEMERSKVSQEFPSITRIWTKEYKIKEKGKPFFSNTKCTPAMRAFYEEALKVFDGLPITRYDVTLSFCQGHKCIIGNGKKGRDVVAHVARTLAQSIQA